MLIAASLNVSMLVTFLYASVHRWQDDHILYFVQSMARVTPGPATPTPEVPRGSRPRRRIRDLAFLAVPQWVGCAVGAAAGCPSTHRSPT